MRLVVAAVAVLAGLVLAGCGSRRSGGPATLNLQRRIVSGLTAGAVKG